MFGFFIFFIILLIFPQEILSADYIPGEIIVKFRDDVSTQRIRRLSTGIHAIEKREIRRFKIQKLKIPDSMSVQEAVDYYRRDPDVLYAEPNYIVRVATTPDDPYFNQLWGLDNPSDTDIDAPEAWDINTGSQSVVIAVVDTGIAYNHPDLRDNIWINQAESSALCTNGDDDDGDGAIDECDECGDGVDNDGNGFVDDCRGWDFIDNDNDPIDLNGHGTHVAGIIGAIGNNGRGITGVMWQVKIVPLRFMGVGGAGTVFDAISAVAYANEIGADVINLSWGSENYSYILRDVIESSQAVVVCAAGNSGTDNDITPFYPASYKLYNIISVAATDQNGNLASFSNYGTHSVHLGAPGVSIYSLIPQFSYGSPVTIYSEDFDSVSPGELPSNWLKGGTNSTWAVTSGTGVSGTNSLEDSPSGNYQSNTDSWVVYLNPIDSIIKENRYTLSFKWKGKIETYDYLLIYISTDGYTFYSVDYVNGDQTTEYTQFSTTEITIGADLSSSFYIGLGLLTDSTGNYDGVYIDDFSIIRESVSVSGHDYGNNEGTSMAAPYVSGVAGLLISENPSLKNYQTKALILNNVKEVPSLSGKVMTGGRLNAHEALSQADSPQTPTDLTVQEVTSSKVVLVWNDNSVDEDGFKIERKTDPEGSFSEISSVPENTTTFTDHNIAPSTTYYYRVRAYGGTLGNFEYSNEVSVTTPSAPVSSGGGGGNGCFIATVAYGSREHPNVRALRDFRDRVLMNYDIGKKLIDLYYTYSPSLAEIISRYEALRLITRVMLFPLIVMIMHPLLSILFVGVLIICYIIYRLKSPLTL